MDDLLNEFVGTRELDPTTLAYEKGRPGRRAVYKIARTSDGLEFTLDADDADDKPMYFTYGGKLDGLDRPIPGFPLTLALAQLEDGSIESVAKEDGAVVDRWTRKLTDDRNLLLICQHVIDSAGNKLTNSALYRRTNN